MNTRKLIRRISRPDAKDIDELYGLEPVYEPGQGGPTGQHPDEFVALQCPWCGERLETHVDVTAGPQTYIEDCAVCCRPMELTVQFEDSGAFSAIQVRRLD